MNAALLKSERQDWQTPGEIIDIVRELGAIDLDPCPSTDHDQHFAINNLCQCCENDGLEASWGPAQLVYVNPPYGRGIGQWVEKCWAQYFRHGMHVIALVPARTDTNWFTQIWRTSAAICFCKGRLTFVGADSPAPFPSALVYWGQDINAFTGATARHGHVVRP